MLAATDLSLTEIAHALNYTEHSAFTRAFRRWSGQTPSDRRSSHRPPQRGRSCSLPEMVRSLSDG
nr:AraC family transcriptional regulator [Microvirga zambiensis]